MRRNGKCIAILLAVILAALGVVLPSEAAEEPQIVYVAGASDSFPIEFYDRQEHRYKGMLPLLLERMNGQGQYQFIYLHPGSMDRREELAKNTQVDMYTGFDREYFLGSFIGNRKECFLLLYGFGRPGTYPICGRLYCGDDRGGYKDSGDGRKQ